MMDPKNSMVFKKITNKEEALKMINEGAMGFFVVAILQLIFGHLLEQEMYFDAAIFLGGAFLLKQLRSKLAAIILLLQSLKGVVLSVGVKLEYFETGGTNIIISLLVLWFAARVVEATFKYYKPD